MNEEEVSSVVGEEVPLDYNGRVKLGNEMIEGMAEEKESFSEYLKRNDIRHLKNIFDNLLFSGPSYLSASIILMLSFGALMTLSAPAILAWGVLGLFMLSPVIVASIMDSYSRYNSR